MHLTEEEKILASANDGTFEHLQSCDACTRDVEEITRVITTISDMDPARKAPAWLRTFQERLESERAALGDHLAPWGAGTHRLPATLPAVEKICDLAHTQAYEEPAEALQLATEAIRLADSIPEDSYPGTVVWEARIDARRERANALRLLGDFAGVLATLDAADALTSRLSVPDFQLATLQYVRATVYQETDRLPEARSLAESADLTFRRFGSTTRATHAKLLIAAIDYAQGDITAARNAYVILKRAELDPFTRAGVLSNLGDCFFRLGDVETAEEYLHDALLLYQEQGRRTERLRTEWLLARLHAHVDTERGIEELRHVRDAFLDHEIRVDAALVTLDLIEIYLNIEETEAALRLSQGLLAFFRSAEMQSRAATLLALLQPHVEKEVLSRPVLQEVRTLLERLAVHA